MPCVCSAHAVHVLCIYAWLELEHRIPLVEPHAQLRPRAAQHDSHVHEVVEPIHACVVPRGEEHNVTALRQSRLEGATHHAHHVAHHAERPGPTAPVEAVP
eukprot:scaffold104672_cov66-Phaeocystis_antarctica.AAC.2